MIMIGDTSLDFHWLVGLLEGEGTFLKPSPSKPVRVIIAIEMTDQDVVERVARLWGVSARPLALRNEAWKPTYATRITGPRAYEWMQRLRPFMSARRKEQIDRALSAADAARVRKPCLTSVQHAEIAAKFTARVHPNDLAAEYGISRRQVYKIVADAKSAVNMAAVSAGALSGL